MDAPSWLLSVHLCFWFNESIRNLAWSSVSVEKAFRKYGKWLEIITYLICPHAKLPIGSLDFLDTIGSKVNHKPPTLRIWKSRRAGQQVINQLHDPETKKKETHMVQPENNIKLKFGSLSECRIVSLHREFLHQVTRVVWARCRSVATTMTMLNPRPRKSKSTPNHHKSTRNLPVRSKKSSRGTLTSFTNAQKIAS